jgi:hypothetical protein
MATYVPPPVTTDDLTGDTLPEGTPTTRIFVDDPRGNVSVEIDLSDTSFKGLQKALDKILAKARPYTPTQKAKATGAATEAAEARAWAMAHRPDLNVKDRGQVPTVALEAYREYLKNESEVPHGSE